MAESAFSSATQSPLWFREIVLEEYPSPRTRCVPETSPHPYAREPSHSFKRAAGVIPQKVLWTRSAGVSQSASN